KPESAGVFRGAARSAQRAHETPPVARHPHHRHLRRVLRGGLVGRRRAVRAGQADVGTWLRSFLALPHGIPSHDTFGRVVAALDPHQFEQCFLAWVRAVVTQTAGAVVALDGKTLRHSYDRGTGQAALHLVSAWATANHLVLGQVAVDAKSNEITALPTLLQV